MCAVVFNKWVYISKHASICRRESKIEQLLDLGVCVVWVLDSMANCSRVLVDLVVVSTLECLVAKEVDSGVFDSARLLCFGLDVLQAVSLIPARWEDIE